MNSEITALLAKMPPLRHPACRIPELPSGAPPVPTEAGDQRPERSILYDNPILLLHHYLGAHDGSGKPITKAELAGLNKTARRIDVLLRRASAPHSFIPLLWDEPEHLIFYTSDPIADARAMQARLIQAEELELRTLAGTTVIEFWRC